MVTEEQPFTGFTFLKEGRERKKQVTVMINSLNAFSLTTFTDKSCHHYPHCTDKGNGLFMIVHKRSSIGKNEIKMFLVPFFGF